MLRFEDSIVRYLCVGSTGEIYKMPVQLLHYDLMIE